MLWRKIILIACALRRATEKVSGFKQEIDAAEWTIATVTHSLSGQGFTTALELEVKIDNLTIE